METMLDEELPRSRLAVLLKHFSQVEDGRQSWRVAFPLAEMLLLLTCATIADCDDFDEIVAWGSHHLDFLRRFAPFRCHLAIGYKAQAGHHRLFVNVKTTTASMQQLHLSISPSVWRRRPGVPIPRTLERVLRGRGWPVATV